jgi:hypothetical protein
MEATIRYDVTSTIRYLDGHTENGPSTHVETTASTMQALESAINVFRNLDRDIFNIPRGSEFLNMFKGVISDGKGGKTLKDTITFYVTVSYRGYNENNEYVEGSFKDTITKPAWDPVFGPRPKWE